MPTRNISGKHSNKLGRLVSLDVLTQKGFGFPPTYRVTQFPVGGGFPEVLKYFSDYANAVGLYENLLESKEVSVESFDLPSGKLARKPRGTHTPDESPAHGSVVLHSITDED